MGNRVSCSRCGGHIWDGAGRCASCRRRFAAVEGAPCQAGELIAGRYQIAEHAGAGPLGWIFRAHEISTGGEVALKILSPRFLKAPEEKRTLFEELHKAQQLAHPNIARIYQAGEDEGRPFIAARRFEGLTLRRIMDLRRQKRQRFTLQEVEPIAAQVAAALDAASFAFAHGNLKPDNVIVQPELLELTDFGLAVGLPRAPFMAAQKAAGGHRYLAPELLLGEPFDARTDVYSLGVMLAEMLGGAQYQPDLSLLDRNPALPEPVAALVRRAVSRRPNARFASAGEMAAELSELVAAGPRPAPTPRAAEAVGDVTIVEAHTDPRLRIARALAAARVPGPSDTPQRPQAPLSFAALEDERPSRAPLYAVGGLVLVIVGGGIFSVLSSRGASATEAKPGAAVSEPAAAGAARTEQAKADARKPESTARAEPAMATEPSRISKRAEPSKPPEAARRDAGSGSARSMRDRVRAVKERVEKALEERRRQREEAVAVAQAKRASEESAQAPAAR